MENAANEVPEKGRKIRLFFLNFGKLILDTTKLCFAALVLGTIMKLDFPPSTMLTAGIIASGVGAVVSLAILTILGEK